MKFALVTFSVPCSVKDSQGRVNPVSVMRNFTTIVIAEGKTTEEIVSKASGDLMLTWHSGRHIEDCRNIKDQQTETPNMDLFYKDIQPTRIVLTDTPLFIS